MERIEAKQKNKEHIARVLIVDDVIENITIVKDILKSKYDVIAATTGEKALDLASKQDHLPDLILLDILMPDMDGLEVCKRLKENELTKNIPVIFLTVLDHADDMIKGFEYGGVDYITKPFERNVLNARVHTHIQLKKYQDNLIEMLNERDQVLLEQSKLASLGEMFESVMHQWKQPLSIISTSNTNIRLEKEMEILTDESLLKMLDGIDKTVDHLNKTIDVFRDYLLETNKKEYFSAEDLIDRILSLLHAQLKQGNISVQTDISHCEIFSFKNHIMQVLINILSNAIQVLEKKEHKKNITIKIEHIDDNVKITISDNGGGIKLEDMNIIFEKHFTTKRNKKGTGLGLYICKYITDEVLKGSLEVSNTQEGAQFSLILLNN